MLLAGTLTLKLFPLPSDAVFQVVLPSVLTCTVPVSLPIIGAAVGQVQADRGRAGGVLPRGSTVIFRFVPSAPVATLTRPPSGAAVASLIVPSPLTGVCADAGVQRVGLVAFNNAVARRGDAHLEARAVGRYADAGCSPRPA